MEFSASAGWQQLDRNVDIPKKTVPPLYVAGDGQMTYSKIPASLVIYYLLTDFLMEQYI